MSSCQFQADFREPKGERLMPELDYIKRYFTENADAWIAAAYVGPDVAPKYPLGNERVTLAINAIVERLGAPRGQLLDLGCGGGQLCFEAARLGLRATGIDIAEGMIELCCKHARTLPQDQQDRLDFQVGDVVSTGLPDQHFDAVVALGLIEYLPEDAPFFREAHRLLKPGGALLLTCRNRLFNLFSQNDYTQREIDAGTAAELLDEMRGIATAGVTPETFHALLRSLKSAMPALEEAVRRDAALAQSPTAPRGRPFAQDLRQHTPREIAAAARSVGLVNPSFTGVHPHPLPPAYERIAPHFFNMLAHTFAVFADKPASLAWSSCFQVVFTKPC
jgi:2-polyprenyl-3-methyl-5-hydroxy-6-metoxy-1,4-benzoquinol methylase